MGNFTSCKIVLYGPTGSGKSHWGNLILKKDPNAKKYPFKVSPGLMSETSVIQTETCVIRNTKLEVKDVPGTSDNRLNIFNAYQSTMGTLKIAQDGFNLLLYCVAAKTRFNDGEIQDLKDLQDVLREDCFENMVIVVTQTDRLKTEEREKTINAYKTDLEKLLESHELRLVNRDIVFPTEENLDEIIGKLSDLAARKKPFSFRDIDISTPEGVFAVFEDPTMNQKLKTMLSNCRVQLKALNSKSIKNDKDEKAIEVFNIRVLLLERFMGENQENFRNYLFSIGHTAPFCKKLSNYFLKTDTEDSTFYKTVCKIMQECVDCGMTKGLTKDKCRKLFEKELESHLIGKVKVELEEIFKESIDVGQLSKEGKEFVNCIKEGMFWRAFGAGLFGTSTGIAMAAFDIAITGELGILLGLLMPELWVAVGVLSAAYYFVADSSLYNPQKLVSKTAEQVSEGVMKSKMWERFILMMVMRYCDLY